MPELELDTVWEAGEMSTGDEIDGSSSVSSKHNVSVADPNISRHHKLQGEIMSKPTTTKNTDTIVQVVPNSTDLDKIATIVHEQHNFVTSSKSNDNLLSHISNNENVSTHMNLSNSKLNETISCEAKKSGEDTLKSER